MKDQERANPNVRDETRAAVRRVVCRDTMEDLGKACNDPAVPGVKADAGKPRPGLLPPLAVLEVARVLEFGAQKYSDDNWRKVPEWRKRYADAALRHIFRWLAEERELCGELWAADEESGYHPLAHAACCLLYLIEQELRGAPDVPVEVSPDA